MEKRRVLKAVGCILAAALLFAGCTAAYAAQVLSSGVDPVNGPASRGPGVVREAAHPVLLVETARPYSYDAVLEDCRRLQEAYPELVRTDSIGITADGREIPRLIIGREDAGEQILVIAAIHAREYMTAQLVMLQARDFLRTYPADLMRDRAVQVVPIADPDGVTISQSGPGGLLREEIRQQVLWIAQQDGGGDGHYFERWKANAQGVDLNRQFDGGWARYRDPVGRPASAFYKGSAPLSAPETQALAQLAQSYPFRRTISYHEQGGVIYWYFGQEGALLEESRAFAEAISGCTGYPLDADMSGQDPAGFKDWALEKLGIPSLTVEIGRGACPLPGEQLSAVYEENRGVWETALRQLGGI